MSDDDRTGEVRRPDGYEFRHLGGSRLELRQQRDTNGDENEPGEPILWGEIRYNEWSVPLGYFEDFRERIRPGAFASTIAEDNIVALVNHDDDNLLGRSNPDVATEQRTLTFDDNDERLAFEVALDPDLELDRFVAKRVERRDLEGNSFGFRTVRDEWDYSDEDDVLRDLIEARLFDVGPVTFPAYPTSTNELRQFVPGKVESKIRSMLSSRKAAHRLAARRSLDATRVRELESGLTLVEQPNVSA